MAFKAFNLLNKLMSFSSFINDSINSSLLKCGLHDVLFSNALAIISLVSLKNSYSLSPPSLNFRRSLFIESTISTAVAQAC